MAADRPATEPRTEAGRRLWDYATGAVHVTSSGARNRMTQMIRDEVLRIEAEAAQGAAPRPETGAEQEQVSYLLGEATRRRLTLDEYEVLRAAIPAPRVEGQHIDHLTSALGAINARGGNPPLWDEGAAPRAEGLDVERLRAAVMEGTDPDTGDVWLHREDADILRARLSRPSDERVPEGAR